MATTSRSSRICSRSFGPRSAASRSADARTSLTNCASRADDDQPRCLGREPAAISTQRRADARTTRCRTRPTAARPACARERCRARGRAPRRGRRAAGTSAGGATSSSGTNASWVGTAKPPATSNSTRAATTKASSRGQQRHERRARQIGARRPAPRPARGTARRSSRSTTASRSARPPWRTRSSVEDALLGREIRFEGHRRFESAATARRLEPATNKRRVRSAAARLPPIDRTAAGMDRRHEVQTTTEGSDATHPHNGGDRRSSADLQHHPRACG